MRNILYIWPLLLFSLLSCAQEEHKKPNILFIILDDAGLDLSAYGGTYVNTPGFDAVAKQGVLFHNAYTPNAKCSPSRASLLTGRNPWQLDAAMNHYIYFPQKFKTFPEAFQEYGYSVGYTGKGYVPGSIVWEDGSERSLTGKRYDDKKTTPPTSAISTNDYAGNFEDFLSKTAQEQPWFFWVGINEPHRAYEYGSGVETGKKKLNDIKEVPAYWPDTPEVRNDLLDYAFEIEYGDTHIQRILKTLETQGLLENTLVVVTSDHGMPFPRVKGNQYEHANHVPMAAMWKGKIQPERTVNDHISFIDIAPTFMDFAEIDWKTSGMHPKAGNSIKNILLSKESGIVEPKRDFILVAKERHDPGRPNDSGYPIRGIFKKNMLYVKNYEPDRWPAGNPETGYPNIDSSPIKSVLIQQRRNGQTEYWQLNMGKRPMEELYNIQEDPDCVNNLVNNPEFKAIKNELGSFMEAELEAQGDLRMQGFGHLYEAHPFYKVGGVYDDFLQGNRTTPKWVKPEDRETHFLTGDGKELNEVPNLKTDER